MVFYCKKGDLLKINALYDKLHVDFFNTVVKEPWIEALKKPDMTSVLIEHGEVVMALEGSVPPWFASDRIRCLHNENVVFIKRQALEKYEQD